MRRIGDLDLTQEAVGPGIGPAWRVGPSRSQIQHFLRYVFRLDPRYREQFACVWWVGFDPKIPSAVNVQVTTVWGDNTQCKVTGQGADSAQVQCSAPNGTLVDSYHSVLLGS